MATTINSRQLELDGSTVRDTTTDIVIASTGSEFLKQLDDSVLPNTITLSTTLTNLTAPVVYEWRYSNSVNPTVWNLITGQTGDNLVVTKADFATYLDTGRYVQFKAIVSKLGFISSEDIYTIYQVKESDQVVQVLVNTPNILVPADSDGSITDFSGTSTELRVLVDGKALTYAASGPNTFSIGTLIQAPASSITLGTASNTTTTYNLANISALAQDAASLTIPVTIINSQGTAKPVVNYVQRYYKIKPGQSSVSCVLTNDTHNIPTDAQGNNALYTGSGTQIFVYDGLQELVYDGVGTADGKWKVTATGTNITPGTASVQGTNAVFSVASGITQDTASITFTITGKTFSGVAFSFTKVQTFSKAKSGTNPIIYLINTTSPVITKQAPNAVTSGTYSSVIIRGKKYEGNVETNYGWITVTANGDTEQFPAIDTASSAYTLQPAIDAGKTSYTVRLYNQAAQSGANLLDTEILDVVFKGESSARFSIDNAGSTFVKNAAGSIAPANIVLTTSSNNFTGITYQWQKNGSNIVGATSSTYTVPSSDYSSVNTNTYKCNATGTINGVAGQVLSDTITIPRLDYGTSAPTIVLSNENSTFPAGLSGYTGITFTGGNCDITAYLGTTQLTYAATGANTFNVTTQTSTGATVATGTGAGVTYSIAAPTAMSSDTAYTDITVVMRDAAGTALSSITRRINYSVARTGATGATGAAAARFSIDNAAATFVKDSAGALAPANITLTTSSSNFTGISYQWQKNGVNISGATSSSYAVPSSDYSSVNTNTYKCNATGTINGVAGQVLSDTITIPRLDYGTSAPTVVLSNENSTFPAGLSGYTGITFTGGSCDITAYLGTTQLTYAATGANTFSVTAQTSTGATVATGSGTGTTYSIAAPTAMSAETAYTDITVVIRDAAGTALSSITRRINYSLSRTGATGATGAASARFSIDNAAATFVKDSAGALAPANITLTTSSSNFTGISYQWQKNGVNISGATSSSYAVPSSDYSSVNTNTYKCNATGTINGVTGQVLSDTITIPRLDYGTSAPTVVLSNENSTFPAGLSGYTGITFTGGSCDITAYLGTTQLTYAATGANTFSVTAQSSTGATVATGSGTGTTYSIAAPTAMSAETAYTDITVVIRDAAGTVLPNITRRINYSLARTGATGATGNKSITLTCFLWSSTNITTAPTHSSTLNWTNLTPDTYPATPAQWTAAAPAAPGNQFTLYQLNVIVTAAGTAGSTVFNWSTGNVSRIGYRQDGSIGPTGSSARIAYIVTTSSSAPTTVTADTGDNPPTGGWSFTATSTLTAGQYMYQVDGIYNPTTNATTWGNPYLSNLKVGQLSAIAADMGSITAGSITINSGVASISNAGAAVFKSIKIQDSNGTTILESGGNLDFGRVGGGTKPANNATANAVGSGVIANRPVGIDGDFYFATDTLTSYQKVGGVWVTAANQTSVDGSGNIQGVNSGSGTTVSNDRVRAGGVNLVGNSGFLRNNGTLPTNWATYNNGGISTTTSVQAGGMFGQNYFRVIANAATTQTLGVYVSGGSSDSVKSWEPGQTYCISYWARGQGNAVGRPMEAFNSNMGFTSAGDLENPNLTGSWQRYVFRGVPASNQYTPNGELYLSWRISGTLASGSVIDICCPKVELGTQPSAWTPSPQDTLNQNIAVDGSGQLTGIGTGSGTTVANTQIAVNASGQLTGIGTGVNTTVANTQITVSSGTLQGIGTANVQVDNTYQVIGQNLVTNSDQTVAVTWERGYSPNGGVFEGPPGWADLVGGWNTTNYALNGGQTRNVFIRQIGVATGTADGSGNSAVVADLYPMGTSVDSKISGIIIAPNERACFSVYVASHRCNFQAFIGFYNAAGAALSFPASTVYTSTEGVANTLSAYTRAVVIGTAPANTAFCRVFVRKFNTYAGQGDSYIWFAAPQLEKVNTNTTSPSPYQPGSPSRITQLAYTGDLAATKNILSSGVLASRPAGNDGDFYFATDQNILYQKISGNWVQSANNYTNTNQLTDGALLGQTAVWTSVGSRPGNLTSLTGSESIRNNLIEVTGAGNITGIGTGDGVSVANNQDNIIRSPGGGIYTTQTGTVNGALKIRLPQYFSDTMMRFAVEIYEYNSGYMCTLEIGGYNYLPNTTWYNVTARVIGTSNVEYPVRFGHDGTKCCIWVGNNNESWSYPQVRIRDFFAGYNNVAKSLWESGWQLSFDTAAATNVTATVLDTLPGADWTKTSQKPANLANLSGAEDIQNTLLVPSINSAATTATWGNVTGSGRPQDNATVGATWGTNITSQPTNLAGINSGEGTKLTGIEAGATVGATAGANLKDSNGRTVSDQKLLGNILDSTTWVLGSSGSQTGFPQNPTSSTGSNYIEPNTLPDGSQGLVWVAKAGNAASTSAEGGWDTPSFNIDHTKMYRFSVWIRLAGNGASGNYYLGVGGSTVRDIGGTTNGNPYFMAAQRNGLEVGIWYLVVGYVFPSGYAGIQYNLGGTYRATDGVRINASTDFRWVVGQTSSTHRTYQYYTNSASSYQLFWNPRVELVDGSEPSVAELLAMGNISGRNKIDSSNNNNFISDDGIPGAKVSSIRIGTVNTAVNGGTTSGGRVDIDATSGGRIRIYDTSNTLRLRIGYLL